MKRFIIICLTIITLTSCTKDSGEDIGNKTPQKVDKITIDNTDIHIQGYSDPITIKFNSTADWQVKISYDKDYDEDWMTVEPQSGKAGDAQITLTPLFNFSNRFRSTYVTISANKASTYFNVSQEPVSNSLGNAVDSTYSSSDFSKDGEVYTLQKANVEGSEGVNIVFMGDGFSDRLIADGTYKKIMELSMESLFSMEPYKSFRHFFNCYYVNVVSEDEVVCDGNNTTFKTSLSDNSTHIYGDNATVIEYARKALSEDQDMDDVLVAVAVNSQTHHGSCHMFSPENYAFGAGDGFTIAYSTFATYRTTVIHECSHGFAKLADEYTQFPQSQQQLPQSEIEWYNEFYKPLGWYKNIDVTNDPNKISWSHFLSDARYEKDKVGIFEGAWYYGSGAYRPSANSMMKSSSNGYGFNAPSREAIYYRIHKIAYGNEWEYDYEKFVEYDTKNIGKLPESIEAELTYIAKPHSNPVIYNCSWEQALNGKQQKITNDKF